MTVSADRAFYVHCTDCHYEEFEFDKKHAKWLVSNHDCVKYLRRRVNYANENVRERFVFTVERKP